MTTSTNPQPAQQPFDPMRGVVTAGTSTGVPAGSYHTVFTGAEYLPPTEADPMTGKGGRQWAVIRFTWRLGDGRTVTRETSDKTGIKATYPQVCGWLLGRTLTAGEPFDISGCVGQSYLVTVGPKKNRLGQPTSWLEVVACIPLLGTNS
jgi:hypothetical protein